MKREEERGEKREEREEKERERERTERKKQGKREKESAVFLSWFRRESATELHCEKEKERKSERAKREERREKREERREKDLVFVRVCVSCLTVCQLPGVILSRFVLIGHDSVYCDSYSHRIVVLPLT